MDDAPPLFKADDVRMLRFFARYLKGKDESPLCAADARDLADRIALFLASAARGPTE